MTGRYSTTRQASRGVQRWMQVDVLITTVNNAKKNKRAVQFVDHRLVCLAAIGDLNMRKDFCLPKYDRRYKFFEQTLTARQKDRGDFAGFAKDGNLGFSQKEKGRT